MGEKKKCEDVPHIYNVPIMFYHLTTTVHQGAYPTWKHTNFPAVMSYTNMSFLFEEFAKRRPCSLVNVTAN